MEKKIHLKQHGTAEYHESWGWGYDTFSFPMKVHQSAAAPTILSSLRTYCGLPESPTPALASCIATDVVLGLKPICPFLGQICVWQDLTH